MDRYRNRAAGLATLPTIARVLNLHPYRMGYRGPCPVHGGKSGRSFVISPGLHIEIVMHCFSGCPYSELYQCIRQRVGGDLLPEKHFDLPELIHQVRNAVLEYNWHGRGALTDRAVLLAHCNIAERARNSRYGASVREVAERAKVSIETARRSQLRLCRQGWLRPVKWSDGLMPTVWTLVLPKHQSSDQGETFHVRRTGNRDCHGLIAPCAAVRPIPRS